ncbi:IMP dehydrogenase [Shigella flexneri]
MLISLKSGIGPGFVCTTRVKQASVIRSFPAGNRRADAAHGLGGTIRSDGGCTTPGDVAKAFPAGRRPFRHAWRHAGGRPESGGRIVRRTARNLCCSTA